VSGGGGVFFEETDFQTYGDDAATFGVAGVVIAEGAEAGEASVAVAGEVDAGGDEAAVEFEDSAELNFEA
jgi:hypothetical protein